MSFIKNVFKNITNEIEFLRTHRLKEQYTFKGMMKRMSAGARFIRRHPLKKKFRLAFCFILVFIVAGSTMLFMHHQDRQNIAQRVASTKTERKVQSSKKAHSKLVAEKNKNKNTMREPINWRQPSETVPYPSVKKHPNLAFYVDISKQRVYLRDGKKTLYTMYASTGKNNSTPRGDFAIQAERGYSFYNPEDQGGANYYTSWYQHGVYLFHTVPTDKNGQYILSAAKLLGTAADSHGCIRLSVPDARWINENAKVGMAVHVY